MLESICQRPYCSLETQGTLCKHPVSAGRLPLMSMKVILLKFQNIISTYTLHTGYFKEKKNGQFLLQFKPLCDITSSKFLFQCFFVLFFLNSKAQWVVTMNSTQQIVGIGMIQICTKNMYRSKSLCRSMSHLTSNFRYKNRNYRYGLNQPIQVPVIDVI